MAAGERGAAAAAAAEEEGVAAADELEGAPFPDPGNDDDDDKDEDEDDDDDESGDARAATRRWERTGEQGRGSRGVEEVELSAACIAAEDAADVIAAGGRSAVALLGVAAGAAQAAETTPLLF